MSLKYRCDQASLLKAITGANRAVASRGSMLAALTGLHFELAGGTLSVTGSDLDMTITMTVDVAGEESGVAVVPAKLLLEVVRVLPPGGVEVSVTDDEARLASGATEFAIRVLPANDWPVLPSVEGDAATIAGEEFRDALDQVVGTASVEEAVTTEGPAFRDALGQVVRSASTDETRPILTGVLMSAEEDGLRLVSTDSYRLARRDLSGSALLGERQEVLVPGRALSEVRRAIGNAGEVTLRLSGSRAEFEVGRMRLTIRLIEGNFPNYKGLIPTTHPNTLKVQRERLLEAVRRVRLLARDTTPVRLVMSAQELELRAVTQDVGSASESMEAQYDGEDLTIAFNPQYLTDGLEVVSTEEVTLETADALKPALLRPVGDDTFLYLLMPVRVS